MGQYNDPTRGHASPFSRLSTDLKLDIFGIIRSKYDQGHARLVCQDWNHHVRSLMFRNIKTSLRSTFPEEIPELAEGEDSCFHGIRKLTVGGRHEDPLLYKVCDKGGRRYASYNENRVSMRSVGPNYDARFSSLMHQLRNNQLLEFDSPRETPLTAAQLIGLLRHQTNLRSFRARVDLSDVATEDRASWTTEHTPLFVSALHSLRSLRIYVGYDSIEEIHGSQYAKNCNGLLLKAAPHLDRLEICGWPHLSGGWSREALVRLMAIFGNTADSIQIPQTLSHLLLADLILNDSPERFLDEINVGALRSLKLEFCVYPFSFLRRLASSLRQTKAQIKALTVRTNKTDATGDLECLNSEVRDLLWSFAGLEKLEFDIVHARSVDWSRCFESHRNLKSLLISSAPFGRFDLPDIIGGVLQQCPHLQSLSYNPAYDDCSNLRDCQLPSSLPSTLYDSLDVVATAPMIRTLRLIYAPGLFEGEIKYFPFYGLLIRGDPEWAEKAAQFAHRQASLILAHLHSKGSNIRVLALSPASRWEQHRPDRNLHYYPHYFYKPGIVKHGDHQVVEAVPIRDYVAECPDAAVFV